MKRVNRWHILLIGLLILALSGLFLWLAFCSVNTTLDKVLDYLATVLSLFLSSIFFIIFACSFGKKHNVFLYDKKLKKEIDVESLTFERICEFLDLYMNLILHTNKSITFIDFTKDDFLASVPKQYRSLILMRLLLIWMEIGSQKQWKQFAESDKRIIDSIENILFNCGEYVISSRLQYLRASYTGDDTEIEEFFLGKIEYLRGFILTYVKSNIRVFG